MIVTHNMQQAARVSDRTAFFTTEVNPESDRRTGLLVEYNPTPKIFSNPDDERTEQYVTGTVRMTNDLRHELPPRARARSARAVARLAASVTELMPRVTEILLAQDLEGAEYVILGDDEIDARSIEIEERCLSVLALQAPVASDLRQIVSALKLAPEIERSADLCVNICKAARRIYGHDLDPKLRGVIQKMGEQAQHVVQGGDRGVPRQRRRPCGRPRRHGLPTSTTCSASSCNRSSRATPPGHIDLQVAVQLAVVARFFERIGDHAVNIGEKVQYVASGWMPEHVGAARYAASCRIRCAEADAGAGMRADPCTSPSGSHRS